MRAGLREILTVAGTIVGFVGLTGGLLYFAGPLLQFSSVREAAKSATESAPSPWMTQEAVDRLTDEHSLSAVRRFQGQRYRIDVAIKCLDYERLVYEFTTFDPEGEGVSMLTKPDVAALAVMNTGFVPVGPVIKFAARIDRLQAQHGYVFDPQYSNELIIGPRTMKIDSSQLANGSTLLIRLPTKGGEETIEIDQTDPQIAQILEGCVVSHSEEMEATNTEPSGQADASFHNLLTNPQGDLGGAKLHMRYDEFRAQLIRAGFEPLEVSKDCTPDIDYRGECRLQQFPEVETCSSDGYCKMWFERENQQYSVTVFDIDNGGDVQYMGRDRFGTDG